MCRTPGSARLDPAAQADSRCTLPGFDRGAWSDARVYQIHLGARPRWDLEGKTHRLTSGFCSHERPAEDIEVNGCPGAFYRTSFSASLLAYYRRADGNGGRVASPALDRCDDPLVHEAIFELEGHEDCARAEYLRRLRPTEDA